MGLFSLSAPEFMHDRKTQDGYIIRTLGQGQTLDLIIPSRPRWTKGGPSVAHNPPKNIMRGEIQYMAPKAIIFPGSSASYPLYLPGTLSTQARARNTLRWQDKSVPRFRDNVFLRYQITMTTCNDQLCKRRLQRAGDLGPTL